MGALTSRQNIGMEEQDVSPRLSYRYPPKSGSYFGTHFIMGGERFDTSQPEAYLFGENSDLNFLGNRPVPFPYPAPQPNEPTKTLKSLVNIRKESVRFVKVLDDQHSRVNGVAHDTVPMSKTSYNIEFTFDCDIKCAITISYFCTEDITANGAIYTPKDASMNSETYHYKKGANQQFVQVSHVFDPSLYLDEELNYSFEKEMFPIVIQCVTEDADGPSESKQSHITICIVEKNSDCTYTLKALKQKQFVDGLCYLLQEIYGIENKNAEYAKALEDDEIEDNGSECVICMSEMRDTLILPCRHLCLCYCCAESLRFQANNCPICRSPFRALLQIRAVRKAVGPIQNNDANENVPPGFEAVSLIEALNGPPIHIPSIPPSVLQLSTGITIPASQPVNIIQNSVQPPVTQQDAITSPSIPVPVDASNCRNFTGSFSSIQVAATMEDCAAQTDCPISPTEVVTGNSYTPEVCLSVLLPETPEKKNESSQMNFSKILRKSKSSSLEKVVVNKEESIPMVPMKVTIESNDPEQEVIPTCISVTNSGSTSDSAIITINEKISMSNESLNLCEGVIDGSNSTSQLRENHQPDTSPGGEESDYYTPEDPNTTILTEQRGGGVVSGGSARNSNNSGHSCSSNMSEAQSKSVLDSDGLADEESEGTPLRGAVPTYIEAISLPGTPLSHSSNRSSGDSFSSMSSTRLLLPNQSQETLSEDRSTS
ncbi:hypothetical protein CHUAL_005071 [Chamberlinius hualienensis]